MTEAPAFLRFEGVVAATAAATYLRALTSTCVKAASPALSGPTDRASRRCSRPSVDWWRPRLGQIWFKGTALVGLSPRQILRLGIVQVPQNHSLFREMTVDETLTWAAYLLKDKGAIAKRKTMIQELFPIVVERARDKAAASRAASSAWSNSRAA